MCPRGVRAIPPTSGATKIPRTLAAAFAPGATRPAPEASGTLRSGLAGSQEPGSKDGGGLEPGGIEYLTSGTFSRTLGPRALSDGKYNPSPPSSSTPGSPPNRDEVGSSAAGAIARAAEEQPIQKGVHEQVAESQNHPNATALGRSVKVGGVITVAEARQARGDGHGEELLSGGGATANRPVEMADQDAASNSRERRRGGRHASAGNTKKQLGGSSKSAGSTKKQLSASSKSAGSTKKQLSGRSKSACW